MNFYQVNQRKRSTFEHEFKEGYLCSPSGNREGWRLMKELRAGAILFNYNSTCRPRGAVLGISKVTNIGRMFTRPKGTRRRRCQMTNFIDCGCVVPQSEHLCAWPLPVALLSLGAGNLQAKGTEVAAGFEASQALSIRLADLG
jgi:hypothetical protein